MFYGYLNGSVAASGTYNFTTKYKTANIGYNAGTFTIYEPGIYEINFDSSSGGVGNITPTLYINGTASTYALSSATSTAATDLVSNTFSTIIKVIPNMSNSYTTLSIVNTGVAATVTTANISIKRIA